MSRLPYDRRANIAANILNLHDDVAHSVTKEFLARHPDWLDRYGEAARRHGIEDARFHLRFLAGSIEAGDPERFRDYLRWTGRMLSSRGILNEFLLENLEQILAALAQELSEEDAELVRGFVESATAALSDPEGSNDSVNTSTPHALTRQVFIQALLQGERQASLAIVLEAVQKGAPILDIYVDVLQEALYEVGRKWELNEITVAQEHLATAIAQFVVSSLYTHLGPSKHTRGTGIITGIRGELHQLGPMMLADALESDGWNVHFLGTNAPARDIADAVKRYNADFLGISTTMLFNVPQVAELIRMCRLQDETNRLRIIVGGRAFITSPELHKEVGADAFAPGLREACRFLRTWSTT